LPSIESILILFAILVASLSFHEAAHAFTADRLGDPTARQLGRITLNPLAHIDWIGTVLFPLVALYSRLPLIGWAKPVPVSMSNLRSPRRDFALIAAAGPASNLLLAGVVAAILAIAGGTLGSQMFTAVLYNMVSLNVMLAVFNMIPVPPLDGGNVLAGLLPEHGARLIDQMRPYGFLVLYALMLSGVLAQFVFPVADAIRNQLLPAY
jgi:Zn-dependent protease